MEKRCATNETRDVRPWKKSFARLGCGRVAADFTSVRSDQRDQSLAEFLRRSASGLHLPQQPHWPGNGSAHRVSRLYQYRESDQSHRLYLPEKRRPSSWIAAADVDSQI